MTADDKPRGHGDEWPDPATPPQEPAPGASGEVPDRPRADELGATSHERTSPYRDEVQAGSGSGGATDAP